MLKKIIYFLISFCPAILQAEMLRSDAIGNDPVKEKICAERAKIKPVPFEIDSKYIETSRAFNPDSTFIADDSGISPQLIECRVGHGNGKFGPASFSPEQGFWHLIRPKKFDPGINTVQGEKMAAKACTDVVPNKINKPDFDHITYSLVTEIKSKKGGLYYVGMPVSDKKIERYDIVVSGKSFYKTTGIDLDAVTFTCLLSPILEMKAIQIKQ